MGPSAKLEWQRGWQLVALTALGLVFAPTTVPIYTLGLFVAPLQSAYGWSHGEIQAAILFSTGGGLVGGPLAGWLVSRLGLRMAIITGALGIAAALASIALLRGMLWQFYLSYALIALLGAGTSAVTWSSLIVGQFAASRGLALGVALAGTGLSAILTPWIAEFGIATGGWRLAFLMLAAFPALVVAPACLWLLPRESRSAGATASAQQHSEHGGRSIELGAALRSRQFWLMGLSTAAVYLALGGIIPNLVPAMTAKGMPRAEAISLMGILGTAIIIGRLAVGAALDRFWAPAVATAVLVPTAIACLLMTTDASFLVSAIAVALVGVATGMEFDVLAFVIARYFGMSDYARIYGRLYIFLACSAGSAPFAFGAVFDQSHSYTVAFLLSAALLALGAAGLLLMGRYPDLPASAEARRGN